MKIKRYKKVQKCMEFYTNNFGFRKPYQILVDGTFCFEALQNKINISDNIPRYLQSEIKFLTTSCVIIEMENLDRKVRGAVVILKKFAVHKCGHEKKAIPGSKCLLSMLGKANENHYIIATQDRDLENNVRLIPGVPLLYLHMKTPVLEHPSEISVLNAKKKLSGIGIAEKTALDQLKQANGVLEEEMNVRKKKKRRGPNPLSCKKKKTNTQQPSIRKKEGLPEKEKRKRKKLRISKHVKEELIKNTMQPSTN
ncbi:hypothetical protein WA026_000615 [Henosepilachna vigintioctopunctata]|uniref:rRNA-processing protein UTP23 homolog n=1 Tax=Henosepilachna vigintioctopunctata TaxID=420089 RepID=A0AAW1V837_9CUCU